MAARPCRLTSSNESAERALLAIVVVGLEFEIADDRMRVLIAPVGQKHNVIAIERLRVAGFRLDHERAIEPLLFLKSRMAVIPVGAALPDGKLIGEGLARRDAMEGQTRNAVHWIGQNDAVPMDRGRFGKAVGDP